MHSEEKLKNLDIATNLRVTNREGDQREFKRNFDPKKIWKYAKTMASFANKKGGIIFFGIKDKPNELIGDDRDFEDNEVGNFLKEYFDPEIEFEVGKLVLSEKNISYILVFPSKNKPVICKKENVLNNQEQKRETLLRAGAIYYRYSSSSTEIKYSELKNIIDEKVKEVFSSLIDNIKLTKEIGHNNVAMISIEDVQKDNKRASVYMTKEAVKNVNWIKKGKFSEDEDSNKAFYVTREVFIKKGIEVYSDPDKTHPLIQQEFCQKINISATYIKAVLTDVEIIKNGSNDEKYYLSGNNGKNKWHKFSESAVTKVLEKYPLEMINRHNIIKNLKNKYDQPSRSNKIHSKYNARGSRS